MRVATNLSRGSLGFNMTPMIDVVFLLIIFFLVSSHLAQQETQLELDLPKASSGIRPQVDNTRRVVVNVLPERKPGGRIMVAGRVMDKAELAELIHFEGKANRKLRKENREAPPLEVRIRCDRKVPYGEVEPVMIACAREGVWKVTFAVVGK
ncbi:MAG: biopolymer transporter ExbD [Thermoguttaceae bacterium]